MQPRFVWDLYWLRLLSRWRLFVKRFARTHTSRHGRTNMVKRYGLLRLLFGGNSLIAETKPTDKATAIAWLQERCPVKLNSEGYAKEDDVTWTVAEFFHD